MQNIPPFEECRLTTMTLVFILEGEVDLEAAFSLLPVTRLTFELPKRTKKKINLPLCDHPGAIPSMRFRDETRGIIRSKAVSSFKNSITIDISTKTKNVSTKLSKSKIQMCGASSEEQGLEGAKYLIQHLLDAQHLVDYMQGNMELTNRCIVWFEEKTKGKITRRQINDYNFEDDNLILALTEDDILASPDERIIRHFAHLIVDFDYHSYLMSELLWICDLKEVVDRDIKIVKSIKAMANYNYNLDFHVDRFALCKHICDLNGFIPTYNNCVDHCVNIKLPYTPDDEDGVIRKKNKVHCHCFLVYKSGVVTQTGPGGDKMKEVYNLFRRSILQIKDKIIIADK